MNILAFLFVGGLTLKGIFILTKLSIDRLGLKYDTNIISLPVNVEQDEFTFENQMETEVIPNSLKPLGKQIYMNTAIQKTFSA